MSILNLSAGADLQVAINNANPGDTIVLQAGTAYGAVKLTPKGNALSPILIQSSALAGLPVNQQVNPAGVASMAKIISDGSTPVLYTAPAAAGYSFAGIEFSPESANTSIPYFLIRIDGPLNSNGDSTIRSLSDCPANIVFDRCYFHVFDNQECKHGLVLNCAAASVLNSYFENFKSSSADSQAIIGWNGPGPFTITNNFIEAAGENVMFGGSWPSWNVVPADILLRNNKFFKRLAWNPADTSYVGIAYVVKNLLEFKSGQRVLVEGNSFTNCWDQGQDGVAWLINIANYSGAGVERCQNIEFRQNRVRNVCRAFDMGIANGSVPSPTAAQLINSINIHDNLFTQIAAAGSNKTRGATGQCAIVLGDNVVVQHNTFVPDPNGIGINNFLSAQQFQAAKLGKITFKDNIVPHGSYGAMCIDDTGAAHSDDPTSFNKVWQTVNIGNNLIYTTDLTRPAIAAFAGDMIANSQQMVGFDGSNDYVLSNNSAYLGKASDGTNPGWNPKAINPPTPIPPSSGVKTTTTITVPSSIITGDQNSKLTVKVVAADGSIPQGDVSVTYSNFGTFIHQLANGVRDYTLDSLPSGVYSVHADYRGSANCLPSQSNIKSLTVGVFNPPDPPSPVLTHLLYESSYGSMSQHSVIPTGFHSDSGNYYLDCLENSRPASFVLKHIRAVY